MEGTRGCRVPLTLSPPGRPSGRPGCHGCGGCAAATRRVGGPVICVTASSTSLVTPQSRKKLGRNANVEGLLALAQSDVRLSSLRSAFPYRAIAVVD